LAGASGQKVNDQQAVNTIPVCMELMKRERPELFVDAS
jgi:hypothetical protein